MPEAMEMIKKELGTDAVILNSKEKKSGGIFGFFQKKKIEVIAALDEEPVTRNRVTEKASPQVKDTEDAKVLEEIKFLQQLLETQSFQSSNNFSAIFEHAYTYLLNQEVDEKIAKQLIDQISNQQSNKNLNQEEVKNYLIQNLKMN